MALGRSHDDIILHAGELAVGADEKAVETFGLVFDQLDVQAAFGVSLFNGSAQQGDLGGFYGPVRVFADGMAVLNGFNQVHGTYRSETYKESEKMIILAV